MPIRKRAWDGKPRRKKIWTDAKLKKLKNLYSDGLPNWQIAKKLKVSINAVNSQLGIMRTNNEVKKPSNKKIIRRTSASRSSLTPSQVYSLKKKAEKLSKENKELKTLVSKIKKNLTTVKK